MPHFDLEMTTPSQVTVSCALLSFVLAYLPTYMRAPGMYKLAAKTGEGLTPAEVNMNPRAMLASIASNPDDTGGYLARLTAAHNNMLEGLSWYYAAQLFGLLAGVPIRAVDAVALIHVICRAGYLAAYANGTSPRVAGLRTTLWVFCQIACLFLFIYAAAVAPKPAY